jgi:hypothetical protein
VFVISDAEKKSFFKNSIEEFRNSNPEEIDLARLAFLTALSSGQPITMLSPQEIVADEDDPRQDDWRERYLGCALDNFLFGHLPVTDSGEMEPGAELPPEVMTVGGTALTTSVENGFVCLTDPYGDKATIKGVVCRSATMIQCLTDQLLMRKEWLGDEPIGGQGTVERLQGSSSSRPLSLSRALGPWDEFSARSKKDSGLLRVRSRVADPKVREFVLENQLFRVRCMLAEDELDGEGMPLSLTQLNRFEDELLMRLVTFGPRTVSLAAVTRRGTHDLYYSARHNGALVTALKAAGDRPFAVRTTHMVGDVALMVEGLTPPAKRSVGGRDGTSGS